MMRADHDAVKKQLSIARGQLEGIAKMVDEDAYCIDVSNQLMATIALLKRLNIKVLSAHLEGCLSEAAKSQDDALLQEKIVEVEQMLKRLSD